MTGRDEHVRLSGPFAHALPTDPPSNRDLQHEARVDNSLDRACGDADSHSEGKELERKVGKFPVDRGSRLASHTQLFGLSSIPGQHTRRLGHGSVALMPDTRSLVRWERCARAPVARC